MDKSQIIKGLVDVLQISPVRSQVRRVSLFGSYLHGTANENSDVDLLIEFKEPVSMFTFVRMEREMGKVLGKKVDLFTPNSLSRYFRRDVVDEAEPLFESVL